MLHVPTIHYVIGFADRFFQIFLEIKKIDYAYETSIMNLLGINSFSKLLNL